MGVLCLSATIACSEPAVTDHSLAKSWVRVPGEETGPRIRVYRPQGFPVAPSRGGYETLTLNPDGTGAGTFPGRDDRPRTDRFVWRTDEAGQRLYIDDSNRVTFRIIELEDDKLVIEAE